MITSNALGHFELTRAGSSEITIKEKTHGLDNAMRTIKNAYGNEKKIKGLTHCPATRLVAREQKEEPPIREASDLHPYSPSHYHGFFHTDHLVPSVFFSKERDPKLIPEYDDLSFRYIYDPIGDPDDHKELMTGEKATAYEVKRNMDRLPDFLDPEIPLKFTSKFDGRIGRWLADRIAQRLVS
jgi:hypothetical protein